MIIPKKIVFFLLTFFCFGGVYCHADCGPYWNAAEEKAYKERIGKVKARLKKDSAYIKMVQAYEIFKRYAAAGEWMLKKGVDYAKVLDSVETLRNPFFDRPHQRSQQLCKNGIVQNDTLKALGDFMFSLYTGGRRKDYFVENSYILYTTKPCVDDTSALGKIDGAKDCDFSEVKYLCIDTKGTKAKRIFLTEEDYDVLDVFMGCNSLTGEMDREEGKIKRAFLPIETHYSPCSECLLYGNEFGPIYMDMVNWEMTVYVDMCSDYLYKKINGVWEKKVGNISCFY